MLPSGFTSRVIARSGQTVAGTGHVWHGAPDGGACFADGTGWIYVSHGDLHVAEDGASMRIRVITPDDIVAPFLRITGQSFSEICGPAFNPAGDRLYFSSQRGTSGSSSGGITYEVTGPFRA
jgi:hypothetical protein